MDLLDLMKTDHQLVAQLFDLIKEETSHEEMFALFSDLKRELELHFQAEEASCYPIFMKLPNFQNTIRKYESDHEDIRKLLGELHKTPDTRDGIAFQNRLLELKNHVESHVIEEERDLFELIRQDLTASEREKLGDLFTLAKTKFVQLVA